jgi:hypothetical protein
MTIKVPSAAPKLSAHGTSAKNSYFENESPQIAVACGAAVVHVPRHAPRFHVELPVL